MAGDETNYTHTENIRQFVGIGNISYKLLTGQCHRYPMLIQLESERACKRYGEAHACLCGASWMNS